MSRPYTDGVTESELRRVIERVAAISDDVERMLAAQQLLRRIEKMSIDVAVIRRTVVLKLYEEEGWSDPQIGEKLGISKVQVGRIRAAAPVPSEDGD